MLRLRLPRLASRLLLVLAAACGRSDGRRAAPALAARATDSTGTFVVLGRDDTIAVERYARTSGRVLGTIVHGDGTRIQYEARVAPDEAITRLELWLWRPGVPLDSRPAQHSITELHGPARDSLVRVDRDSVGPTRIRRLLVAPGSQPYLLPSVGLAQQALRRARALGGDSLTLPVVVLNGSASPQRVRIRWLPRDSVEIGVGGTHVRLGLDAQGGIRAGMDPALGITLQRVPPR